MAYGPTKRQKARNNYLKALARRPSPEARLMFDAVVGGYPCPECGVPIGTGCKRAPGKYNRPHPRVVPHKARIESAENCYVPED